MAEEDDGGGGPAGAESLREDPEVTAAASEDGEEEKEEEGVGFTFAAGGGGGVFGGGCVGPMYYPVFGRPRSPPPPREEEEEKPETATLRVPLAQLLLAERGSSSSPTPDQDDGDGELEGVPAETYCLWSPGSSPRAAHPSSPAAAARCQKSGSTGSVLRWRQRLVGLGRSHSDGKEKFVFLAAAAGSSPGRKEGEGVSPGRKGISGGGGGHGWSSYYGRGSTTRGGSGSRRSTSSSFLPYKPDLLGLFANAGALLAAIVASGDTWTGIVFHVAGG